MPIWRPDRMVAIRGMRDSFFSDSVMPLSFMWCRSRAICWRLILVPRIAVIWESGHCEKCLR